MATEKISKRTRDALKAIEDAVFSLLEKKEFEHVTARDICQQAKVNKMTFYKYYKNKYDALAAAFTSRINDEYGTAYVLWQSQHEQPDLEEANYEGLMFAVDFFQRYHVQFSHLVSSNGDLPKDVVFSALFANYRSFFAQMIGKELTKENDYLVHFVFGAFRSIYECQMEKIAEYPNGAFPKEDVQEACRFIGRAFTLLLRDLDEKENGQATNVATQQLNS